MSVTVVWLILFILFLQLFYLVTETYPLGTVKEMRKWAYEIHSTFLCDRSVVFSSALYIYIWFLVYFYRLMTFVKSTKLHVLFAAYVNVKHNACIYYYCQHCYVVGQWRQYCDEFEMACVGGGSVSGWIVTEPPLKSLYHCQYLYHQRSIVLRRRWFASRDFTVLLVIITLLLLSHSFNASLQCSDTVGWVTGRASGL